MRFSCGPPVSACGFLPVFPPLLPALFLSGGSARVRLGSVQVLPGPRLCFRLWSAFCSGCAPCAPWPLSPWGPALVPPVPCLPSAFARVLPPLSRLCPVCAPSAFRLCPVRVPSVVPSGFCLWSAGVPLGLQRRGCRFWMCTHRQGSQTLLFVCRHKLYITG